MIEEVISIFSGTSTTAVVTSDHGDMCFCDDELCLVVTHYSPTSGHQLLGIFHDAEVAVLVAERAGKRLGIEVCDTSVLDDSAPSSRP